MALGVVVVELEKKDFYIFLSRKILNLSSSVASIEAPQRISEGT
jgi:hypothetical protein